MRRNWLRPKFYLLRTGERSWAESVYPFVTSREPWGPCVRCGADLEEMGSCFELPGGRHCVFCRDAVVPADAPPSAIRRAWRRVWWPISGAYDQAYWWWAERYGKRVHQ